MTTTAQQRASDGAPREPRARPVPISLAPMMERTDRHFRYLLRLISRHTLLYTEMITTGAVIHGDRELLLGYAPEEHPVALQLGGDDPGQLAAAAGIAEDLGYDEVNLNVGCPSDRVQSGNFGACLMRTPETVAECVAAMRAVVSIPVTVKHRIGVDELDGYEDMLRFVDVVAPAGADRFTVHARKAWLRGLSPKENRTIPPLRHEDVYRLKRERPGLVVETNGGVVDLDECARHLELVDGVMIGRLAWDRPYAFAEVDARFFGRAEGPPTRREVAERYLDYAAEQLARGHRPTLVLRVLLNLYAGEPGTKKWKQALNQLCRSPDELRRRVAEALDRVESARAELAARRAEAQPQRQGDLREATDSAKILNA